jgi:cytoskeletal protein CcmA (bactofilin family)
LQEVIILVYDYFMWFKQQTSAKNSDNDPYLGPMPRHNHAQNRQEPVLGTTNVVQTIDLEPVAPVNAPPPQFQHKVANQSQHKPAQIMASKPHVPKTVNNAVTENFTIPADVTIKGSIDTQKSVTIAGKLIGDITDCDQLLLLPGGQIEGMVACKNAEISGIISNGPLAIADLLVCRAGGQINSDISYGRLRIEEGAVINGTIHQNQTK